MPPHASMPTLNIARLTPLIMDVAVDEDLALVLWTKFDVAVTLFGVVPAVREVARLDGKVVADSDASLESRIAQIPASSW